MREVRAWQIDGGVADENFHQAISLGDFAAILDRELKDRRFIAGDAFTVADITGLVSIDFMKPAKLAVPDTMTNLKRWYADVSARPSAKA